MTARRLLELQEYEARRFDADEIPAGAGEYLHQKYRDQIEVNPPTFKTRGHWELVAKGYVGYIPVDAELGVALRPKVPLGNLFRMLEYAYEIGEFRDEDRSLFGAASLEEFYERLANVLAQRVLNRARRGFYRNYVEERDCLPFVRGALDMPAVLRRHWEVRLPCRFEDHTADVEENQILAWTLRRVARAGACSERTLPTVRSAYQSVKGAASLRPFPPEACAGRLYNRLNDDYRPMHALCRFFLENTGPLHEEGERSMLPFLVDMSLLFERFVARWLQANRRNRFDVRVQDCVRIGESGEFAFRIDLVICDCTSGKALAVLDTKYKTAESPTQADVQQVVAYAIAKKCSKAILVYPQALAHPLAAHVGNIWVRTLHFPLEGDLEANGEKFFSELLREVCLTE